MKIGVLGHGSIGSRHAANARALGHDVRVYDPANVRDFRFESQLYDWCEACVIAVPTLSHEGALRACVERGRHALVEKPLSLSMSRSLVELIHEAEVKNLTIMMGNNLRFHPCVQRLAAKIKSAEIKPIWATFVCATPANQNAREGVILSTGAHEVDAAMHLFGPVEHVAGASARFIGTPWPEDIADFTLVHKNGVRSTFHLDFVTEARLRRIEICGGDHAACAHLDSRSFNFESFWITLPGSYDEDYVAEMKAFVARIGGADVPGATGEDGLETLRVLSDVRTKACLK